MERKQACCGDESLIDFSKVEMPRLTVELWDGNLWTATACIIFNPLFWNIVARSEYRTRRLTDLFSSPHTGCAVLAGVIIVLGLFRDWRFHVAVQSQPPWVFLQHGLFLWLGYLSVLTGSLLVLTSYWAIGFYGTFLGDYFGLLLDAKVTSFPFNLMDNPMYWGSTLNFLGTSLINCSQSGLLLSVLVAVVYKIAVLYEGPFTEEIYREQSKKKHL